MRRGPGEPVPTRQEKGHRVGDRGRTEKWRNGRGASKQGERTRESLGDVSVAVESGELSWVCERWGALFSPLDRFLVAPTFPPPLTPFLVPLAWLTLTPAVGPRRPGRRGLSDEKECRKCKVWPSLENDWGLEEGSGQGQEWRRLAVRPSADRMSCPVVLEF